MLLRLYSKIFLSVREHFIISMQRFRKSRERNFIHSTTDNGIYFYFVLAFYLDKITLSHKIVNKAIKFAGLYMCLILFCMLERK